MIYKGGQEVSLPYLAYILVRIVNIYLYCYPTAFHIVIGTVRAFIILWDELFCSILIALCMPWYHHHIMAVTISHLSSKFWPPRFSFSTGHRLLLVLGDKFAWYDHSQYRFFSYTKMYHVNIMLTDPLRIRIVPAYSHLHTKHIKCWRLTVVIIKCWMLWCIL